MITLYSMIIKITQTQILLLGE